MPLKVATVLLVDDELEIVQGLIWSLRGQPYRMLTATSASEALGLLELQPIDVVVSDHQMSGMTGVELLSLVSRRFSRVGRVLLTGNPSLRVALGAVNEGQACRVLIKPCARNELLAAIAAAIKQADIASAAGQLLAARGRADAAPALAPTLASPSPLASQLFSFSSREAEVLDLLSRGNRVEQIAKALFLSSHTVRNHIKAMFRKTGVHSQGELVSFARRVR